MDTIHGVITHYPKNPSSAPRQSDASQLGQVVQTPLLCRPRLSIFS
jgi:hypothetical protein